MCRVSGRIIACLLCCLTLLGGAQAAVGPSAGAEQPAAQERQNEKSPDGQPAERRDDAGREGKRAGRRGLGLDFSKYMNMEPEEGTAALLADVKAALDARVADGTLTPKQAEKIYRRIEASPPKWQKGDLVPDGCFGLGLDMEKYRTMEPREAGPALLADAEAALQAKVAQGEMSRAQADAFLEKLRAMPQLGGAEG